MKQTKLSLLLVAFLAARPSRAASIFNGAEDLLLPPATEGCMNAIRRDISCDTSLLQRISFASASDVLVLDELETFCTNDCRDSLVSLYSYVVSECLSESFNIGGASNMTLADMVDYYIYKIGLVCMRDETTGEFCSDVESRWDISALVEAGQATWPEHTTKVYPNTNEDGWPDLVDGNGLAIDPFVDSPYRYSLRPDQIPTGVDDSFDDFLYAEPPDEDDLNYGWNGTLEFDEYPLEIQCSSCFIEKFRYGLNTPWGDLYDEITDQVASNMRLNCGQPIQLAPANDWRGSRNGQVVDAYSERIVLQNCPRYYDVPLEIPDEASIPDCWSTALMFSVPSASIGGLNRGVNCGILDGDETICLPPPCSITRVEQSSNTRQWIDQFDNFTLPQFMAWNPFASVLLQTGDIVCVGPPGGMYEPNIVTPPPPQTSSTTTTMTTTTSTVAPSPTCETDPCTQHYTPVPGDSCWAIAEQFGTTVDQIRQLNPGLNEDCTNLQVGVDYCISTCAQSYTPVPGDSCWAIAEQFGITVDQFRQQNPQINEDCTNLQVGVNYCISSGGGSVGNC